MNRRTFLQLAGAAGIALAIPSALLAEDEIIPGFVWHGHKLVQWGIADANGLARFELRMPSETAMVFAYSEANDVVIIESFSCQHAKMSLPGVAWLAVGY